MSAPRHGFSLIELLVVMSIIAVLAGILLPAVRMVREMAATATCASNMREVGTFLIAYTGENDGLFPGGGHVNGGSQSWCDILNRELLGDERIPCRSSRTTAAPATSPARASTSRPTPTSAATR